ncbi:hypothetical protein EWM64_g657 [Hericium alpestre]|uniref:Cytochrome P450 n=1 Tax=Hericium alpestre TaxID=135208 RepID=A0A4Z0A9Y8_9AGAM|nr:hypothetical protein EWM64_g657 [Hericium alpestre]
MRDMLLTPTAFMRNFAKYSSNSSNIVLRICYGINSEAALEKAIHDVELRIPHLATTTEDDFYKGMRIPAGALLIPNQYGMGLSQETYGQIYDAEVFEPRRWINRPQGVGDIFQENPGFGFGRRICPGKYMAMQSLFLAVSNLCYWFDIKPINGVTVDIHKYTSGLTMQPEPFDCNITPRAGREAEIEIEAAAARDILASIFQ